MHNQLIKLEQCFQTSPLSKISDPLLTQQSVELWLKRDDLLHPIISGNKWRKLKYILQHVLTVEADTIISMGGAYSNHLHALAYVGNLLGLKTIGLIRGEPVLTPSLKDMLAWGMELRFISRTDYRTLRQYKQWWELPNLKPKQYWLPEGGAQQLALQGVAELVQEIDQTYDVLCVACGTGTTLAGLISAAAPNTQVLGFAAFKHAEFLNHDVNALLPESYSNWQINQSYHFGGFAKTNVELQHFIINFQQQTAIELEPIYTGKMLYGLYDLIRQRQFQGQRIIAIHTGGLQGNRGFNDADAPMYRDDRDTHHDCHNSRRDYHNSHGDCHNNEDNHVHHTNSREDDNTA